MSNESEHASQKRKEFDEKWPAYYADLYRYVLKKCRNEADAEDITQEALIHFKEYMDKNEWGVEIGNVGAYLKKIAHNLYLDLCERRKKEAQTSYDDDEDVRTRKEMDRRAVANDDSIARIEDELHYAKLFRTLPLKVVLHGLSDYELQLLRLKKIEEKSPEKIAEIVNKDVYRIRYDLNKLDAKIRYRVRQVLKERGCDSLKEIGFYK